MNFSTAIVALLVLVVFILIVKSQLRKARKGGCSGCSGCCGTGCSCSSQKAPSGKSCSVILFFLARGPFAAHSGRRAPGFAYFFCNSGKIAGKS